MKLTDPEGHTGVGAARKRALVVDDDLSARITLKSLLTRLGYQVSVVGDGRAAVEHFRQFNPDIVFMDVVMPQMGGLEAAAHIKAAAGERFVPIIFVTGEADDETVVGAIQAGGDDLMAKPYSQRVLAAKVMAMDRICSLHQGIERLYDHVRAEQETAEKILRRAILGANPVCASMQFHVQPAATFSGDIVLAAYTARGDLNVLMGDFTGHGLVASIGSLPTAETFRSMSAKGIAPAGIVREINRKLHLLLPTGSFLCALLVQVSRTLNRVEVGNFGIPDMLVISASGVRERIGSTAIPLGIAADVDFAREFRSIAVAPGERLLMMSDGVREATSPSGKVFDIERAIGSARATASLLPMLRAALCEHCDGRPLADDASIAEIHIDPELFAVLPADSYRPRVTAGESWEIRMTLSGDAMRTVDPVPRAIEQLRALPDVVAHCGELYTILSELYANALEHGVLRLDSKMKCGPEGFERYLAERERRLLDPGHGAVSLRITRECGTASPGVVIRVQDSGDGFDWERELVHDDVALHGRGLMLVRALCASLEFNQIGNRVTARYPLRAQA
jgi:CheY-like chemotaxis protein